MSSLANVPDMARCMLRNLRGLRAPRRRTMRQFIGDVFRDTWLTARDVYHWARQLKWDWRHEREYLMNRVFMISLAWGLAHTRTLIDIVRGVPAIYLVFGNYDEIAHRRGPLSKQATQELFRVDAALEELYALAKSVENPYDVYFVTDHGHVDSRPIEQRTGKKLEAFLLEGSAPPLTQDVMRGLLDGRGPDVPAHGPAEQPVVIEAGNFAHVYLTRGKDPLEARQLLARHPEILARATTSPEIAIVAVRRGDSAVAIIAGGVYGPDEIDRSPLDSEFSKRAVVDLLRELPHMRTAGDLVLYGQAIGRGTVGFAWEFGSHGGLTRTETDSVVCWPSQGPVNLSGLSHCSELHAKLAGAYQ